MEKDLLLSTRLTLQDFGPEGIHPWDTLVNLVEAFQDSSKSHLSAAMARDIDLYAAQLDENGKPPEGRPFKPPLTEVGTTENILMAIYEMLQIVAHRAGNSKGKAKVTPFPRPDAAAALYQRHQEKLAEEDLLSLVVDG